MIKIFLFISFNLIFVITSFSQLIKYSGRTSKQISKSHTSVDSVRSDMKTIKKEDSPEVKIIFSEVSEGNVLYNKDYYLNRARKDQSKGIILTSIGYPFVIGGSALMGFSAADLTTIKSNSLSYESNVAILITSIVMVTAGIPLSIKGPVLLDDAKYFRKKAAQFDTSYEVEPTIIRSNLAQNAYGLSFKLNF